MGILSRLKKKMDEAFADEPLVDADSYYPPDAKPQGQATVVQDDPLEIFPNENDNPSQ